MTPTSHAAQAGIDLDKLEALARAASEYGDTIGVDEWHTVDGELNLLIPRPDVELISACSPVAVLQLIHLARKAACAAQDARQSVNPAADERALFEKHWPEIHGHGVDGGWRGTAWAAWQARAALATHPAPETSQADDFDSWWTTQIAANGGTPIGADYRHWAEQGYKAAHAQQDAALRQEVIAMYQLLDDGEWAEHIARTPHGQCLETAITKLVGKSAATGKAAAAKDAEQWTKTPPTEQADYWHWNGDPDHAPMIYHVMWSGTAKKCFVSMGQYDIDEAIWCDNFGGWWLKIEQPSIPSGRAAIAASQKGGAA